MSTGGWGTLFALELAHVRAEARGPDPDPEEAEEPLEEVFASDEWPYPDEDPPDPL